MDSISLFLSPISIILISVLLILLVFEIYFYFSYYLKALKAPIIQKKKNFRGKISVIISAENDADRLGRCLPLLLEQDYPDFEVIVINNGSTDATDYLIEDLCSKYSNLYCTFVPVSRDKQFGKKKLALTIGAKAAKGDFLLFTEPYVIPQNNRWISAVANSIGETTEVVLGVSNIIKQEKFYNKMARYNNLLFSLQYVGEALKKEPFTGVYRNLALKKQTFFEKKGFASALKLENSEDLFINQIVDANNTTVCLDPDGINISYIDNYMLWRHTMKNYSIAKCFFKNKCMRVFALEKIIRTIFYFLSIVTLVYSVTQNNYILLGSAIIILLIKWIFNWCIVKKSSTLFNNGIFNFSLPIVDFLQPLYCSRFRSRTKLLKK